MPGLHPGLLHQANIFRIRLCAADLHESPAHLLQHKVVAEGLDGIQFAVMPGALEELQHQHAHAISHGSQGRAHGGSGFALAGAGVDEDQAFSLRCWCFAMLCMPLLPEPGFAAGQ